MSYMEPDYPDFAHKTEPGGLTEAQLVDETLEFITEEKIREFGPGYVDPGSYYLLVMSGYFGNETNAARAELGLEPVVTRYDDERYDSDREYDRY